MEQVDQIFSIYNNLSDPDFIGHDLAAREILDLASKQICFTI
jgi:hypothetical protein